MLRQALSEMLPQANAKSLGIDLDGAPQAWVQGHRDALTLLVRNLLDNAIKYTPAGKRIHLHLEQTSAEAALLIDDEGPGIAPEERERVFDRFYRVEGNAQHGSGLGLAIARSIADQHGAAIELQDTPAGSGLRVKVVFPT